MKAQTKKVIDNLLDTPDMSSVKAMAKAISIGVISFLLGGASLFGALFPFAAAFIAAIPTRYIFTSAFCSIIGILFLASSSQTWWLVFSVLLCVGLKIALKKLTANENYKLKPILFGLIAFSSMLLPVIFQALSAKYFSIDIILLFIQTVLCGCFGYFFSIASNAVLSGQPSVTLSSLQLTSCGILLIAAICGGCSYELFNLNLGVILGVLIIYIIINRYGIVGASVASIVVSIALNLHTVEMLPFAAMLIIASFISGAFSALGKPIHAASFILVSSFCMILLGAPVWLTYRIIDIFVATAMYLLLPKRLMSLINISPAKVNDSIHSGIMQQNVSSRLLYASDTIKDLQRELKTVSDKFGSIDYNNIGSISDAVSKKVCTGCSRALDCWDRLSNEIMDAFNNTTLILRETGKIGEDNIPSFFSLRCCKLTRLIDEINLHYEAFLAGQASKRQLTESRNIVFEQFSSMTDMLCEISSEIGQISGYDEGMAKRVDFSFEKLESKPLQTICSIDKYGRTTVEIYTDNIIKTSPNVLCQAISSAADCIFDLPDMTTVCAKTRLAFFEKASYCVDYSIQQICCGDNSICGDSTEHFTDSKGYSYFILSDGMGSGRRAAIDSTMTCSIMSKLLRAGFGVDSALKLINSSLLVKSTDESLSTLDLARIDLYTGKVELFKSGAATTFLAQSGSITRVSSAALPIGILQNAECEKRLFTLRSGDFLLLLSDGATQNGESFIADSLKRLSGKGKSAKEVAVSICSEIKEHKGEQEDDITVIAIKITKGI